MSFEGNRAIVEATVENILDVGVNWLATMMARHGFVPPEPES